MTRLQREGKFAVKAIGICMERIAPGFFSTETIEKTSYNRTAKGEKQR